MSELDEVAPSDGAFIQGARFGNSGWALIAGEHAEFLTIHERHHKQLNDLTTYGLVLDSFAMLAVRSDPSGEYGKMLGRLVGRCRTTHEVFATFLGAQSSLWSDVAHDAVRSSAEYLGYYHYGRILALRLPAWPLGLLAVSAACRISMNGPLPDSVRHGDFQSAKLSHFRAGDAPDYRLVKCLELLDADFWLSVYKQAFAMFGEHPQWKTILDNRSGQFSIDQYFRIETAGDLALISPGGIDMQLETDVGNFFVDCAANYLSEHGIHMYTLEERRDIETTLRSGLPDRLPRFYDSPNQADRFNHSRDHFGESIVFRPAPIVAAIHPMERLGNDWQAYVKILRAEGALPIYLRDREDVAKNHGLDPEQIPSDDGVCCFLRKKRYNKDGSIGLDLHFIESPERLNRLFYIAAAVEGRARLFTSGKLLLRAAKNKLARWLEAAHGMHLSILIDAMPAEVIAELNSSWSALVWHVAELQEVPGQQVLFVYPIGDARCPDVGFFRPCTWQSADAVIRLFNPTPIPAIVQRTGANIVGIPKEVVERPWQIPPDLVWTAKRYLSEEFRFSPRALEGTHGR